jgi:hypothetical protein
MINALCALWKKGAGRHCPTPFCYVCSASLEVEPVRFENFRSLTFEEALIFLEGVGERCSSTLALAIATAGALAAAFDIEEGGFATFGADVADGALGDGQG